MFAEYSPYWQKTLNWELNQDQDISFQKVYDLVIEGNKTQNLTRIVTPPDFWEKHIWDSLRGVLPIWRQQNLKVIDIGTGAGFPGIPVAIAHPTWQLTLLDSTLKKTAFIDHVCEVMSLSNVKSLTGRAEQLHHLSSHRQNYDAVLVRAVGNADLCTQYSIPFLKKGGVIILYRGQWSGAEQISLEHTCKSLRAKITYLDQFLTPLSLSMRNCIHISLI
ncbi:16S rRNA (guanine(527)-N(7))-methyltransferase GidB [Synechococcus sp. PCC 7502]|uniref:16S rRNA (guanine(527)-N(7))-methyltransferase RsmG n=1 Tax=Synechococcus sp. PCC 7502 TaxID=1173263 RepID=UPI00029FEDCB|nr:16S rRNA (guanine(527)-N(7))-methyltransferase RsmG [Synechococcus sp. PCC 7502]AFY74856.1 16S rRNA (guanine(527)-N(7))-methyltransferase GidB [Synechococcus sp. PCC 7502]